MIRTSSRHKCLTALLTVALTMTLVVAGLRLPDLSSPHRPKPKPRAVVETEAKASQLGVKKAVGAVAVLPPAVLVAILVVVRTLFQSGTPSSPCCFTIPQASRAPPCR